MPTVQFLPDQKSVEITGDQTLLEASMGAGIAHAHACGGEGRCSTCRVLLLEGVENCSAPNEVESEILKKLRAPEEMRLACQTKITGDVTARRLVLNDEDIELASLIGKTDFGRIGDLKQVAILFSDIRGFTAFSETLLPYDIIFFLNRYFSKMVAIIELNGGRVDNYIGDGLFAMFGIDDEDNAALLAVKAAAEMLDAVDEMKPYMKTMYGHKFEIGIGIHLGEVVVGDIGSGKSKRLTAIGDAVNLASRIESANKEFKSRLLISEAMYERVKDAVIMKDFVRTNLKGIEDRITLYEISGLNPDAAELESKFFIEDGLRWYSAGAVPELAEGEHTERKLGDRNVLLIKHGEHIRATADKCPHMNLKLKGSKINENGEFVCKWHQSRFCVDTGEVKQWCGHKMLQFFKNFEFAKDVLDVEESPLAVYKTKISDGTLLVGFTD